MFRPTMSQAALAEDVFQAIASPTRRALLDVLTAGESNVSDLVGSLEITQSAVSQHLAVLKSAGLVTERAEGRFRLYRLRAEPLTAVDAWLVRYRAHMERQLDALGRVLDVLPDTASEAKEREALARSRPTPTRARSKRRSRP
jgi:DNA-binding transcriptional ArsR family regulator